LSQFGFVLIINLIRNCKPIAINAALGKQLPRLLLLVLGQLRRSAKANRWVKATR